MPSNSLFLGQRDSSYSSCYPQYKRRFICSLYVMIIWKTYIDLNTVRGNTVIILLRYITTQRFDIPPAHSLPPPFVKRTLRKNTPFYALAHSFIHSWSTQTDFVSSHSPESRGKSLKALVLSILEASSSSMPELSRSLAKV
jgi:hypothetical protein